MRMVKTKIIRVSSQHPEASAIEEAAEVLRNGGLVAFPTETVYGLGADATNPETIKKVFEVKGRPPDNPLIVHISDPAQLQFLAKGIPPKGKLLAETFWPGPLTIVVKRSDRVPDIVSAGLDTVAIRMPNHPITLQLVKVFGRAIVGPSANISGTPSPTTAEHVFNDLHGKIDMILDAGPTQIGVESTVVDVTADPPLILRFGALARSQIEKVIGFISTAAGNEELRRSPGTRHRHYAPAAKVILFEEGHLSQLRSELGDHRALGKRVGCIVHSVGVMGDDAFVVSLPSDIERYSQQLFSALRELDERGVDVILVECVPEVGIGEAVMDRLRRAAHG